MSTEFVSSSSYFDLWQPSSSSNPFTTQFSSFLHSPSYGYTNTHNNYSSISIQQQHTTLTAESPPKEIPDELKVLLTYILKDVQDQTKEGLNPGYLLDKLKRATDYQFDFRTYGFDKFIQFLEALPEIVYVDFRRLGSTTGSKACFLALDNQWLDILKREDHPPALELVHKLQQRDAEKKDQLANAKGGDASPDRLRKPRMSPAEASKNMLAMGEIEATIVNALKDYADFSKQGLDPSVIKRRLNDLHLTRGLKFDYRNYGKFTKFVDFLESMPHIVFIKKLEGGANQCYLIQGGNGVSHTVGRTSMLMPRPVLLSTPFEPPTFDQLKYALCCLMYGVGEPSPLPVLVNRLKQLNPEFSPNWYISPTTKTFFLSFLELFEAMPDIIKVTKSPTNFFISFSDELQNNWMKNPMEKLKVIVASLIHENYHDYNKDGFNPSVIRDLFLRGLKNPQDHHLFPLGLKAMDLLQTMPDVIYIDKDLLKKNTKGCRLSKGHPLYIVRYGQHQPSTNTNMNSYGTSKSLPNSPMTRTNSNGFHTPNSKHISSGHLHSSPVLPPNSPARGIEPPSSSPLTHRGHMGVNASPPRRSDLSISSLGTYRVKIGRNSFFLPIDASTTEIILIDLDNTYLWIPNILEYTKRRNGGNPSNHSVVSIGFCSISFETSFLTDLMKGYLQLVRMSTSTKEATDHAISFYASRILCDHFFNLEHKKGYQRLNFVIVSKDHALHNTVHFLQSEGVEAQYIASTDALRDLTSRQL